jgi:hypothetical protein
MVDVPKNNQRLPHKIVTRTDLVPLGMPSGTVLVGHSLEVLFNAIDDSGWLPVVTPAEILNKTHEGGDIFNFTTGKLYDSYQKSKTFDPWEDYVKDMDALNRGEL